MNDLLNEFTYRASLVQNLAYNEANDRLSGLYKWLNEQPQISAILISITEENNPALLLSTADARNPPQATSPEQIAAVGLELLNAFHNGEQAYNISEKYGIRPTYSTRNLQDHYEAIFDRFISPALDYVLRELTATLPDSTQGPSSHTEYYPLEITESLNKFRIDHPDPRRTAFIMMQFGSTPIHNSIVSAIRSTLAAYNIEALRADDKEYHDDLFPNVLTYIHGCSFGISVFERLQADDFNPNVSLEVGYMRAIRKPICLLKDKTLPALHTDLVGKLYKAFDPQDPTNTIPPELDKWLHDKDIVT